MGRKWGMTRRRIAAAVAFGVLLSAPVTADAVPVKPLVPVPLPDLPVQPAGIEIPPESVPQEGCQPDPLETGIQKLRCRYGPIVVTPGSNLILIGPVTIEQPRAEGFMLKMTPNMIDAVTGEVPHIHEVHLHHGVWLDAGTNGLDVDTPFMAAGEEKSVSSPPPGYGYRVHATDEWLLNYMIHNQTAGTYTTFITYDLDWINASSPAAANVVPVKPIWWDTVGGAYPVYNPTTAAGAPDHVRRVSRDLDDPSMEVVWMVGHVHPGGKRIDLTVNTCGATARNTPIFSSEALPNVRPGTVDPDFYGDTYGSWDYLMTATKPEFRFTMGPGDAVFMDTVYDSTHPWYEAMGIVFGWGVPLDEAPPGYVAAPRCQPPAPELTTGIRTNVLPRDPIFGGTSPQFPDPATTSVQGQPPVNTIDIRAFDFAPGGTAKPPAPVAAGSNVVVRNIDAAASVFHTVTECADACNKDTGQSYPLPDWGFDSAQLGYGIPGLTAAKNAYQWTWPIPAGTPLGTTLPFFCRVHPFMRGSVQVVG
ncbi:MAG TPA: hypothetical protein VNB24_06710 [Acidimicrobiales bacterium]|nr:hypothetical protein [Acidimicrobiales bacterium]